MTVTDCPDHPCAALRLHAGVFCFACGREIVDTELGLIPRAPTPTLLAEAREEWETNATVAAFGAEAQLAARGMLEGADDA